jgi:hypothetical protein
MNIEYSDIMILNKALTHEEFNRLSQLQPVDAQALFSGN